MCLAVAAFNKFFSCSTHIRASCNSSIISSTGMNESVLSTNSSQFDIHNGRQAKKCKPIKATLIAKKDMCWRVLEEEKWRTTDSSIKKTSSFPFWQSTLSTDDKSTTKNNVQHQEQSSSSFRKLKTSISDFQSDLISNDIGMSCLFRDNCRCLDCQSRYFDCEDNDSWSDTSVLDDIQDGDMEHLLTLLKSDMINGYNAAETICYSNYDNDDECTLKYSLERNNIDMSSSGLHLKTMNMENAFHERSAKILQ